MIRVLQLHIRSHPRPHVPTRSCELTDLQTQNKHINTNTKQINVDKSVNIPTGLGRGEKFTTI